MFAPRVRRGCVYVHPADAAVLAVRGRLGAALVALGRQGTIGNHRNDQDRAGAELREPQEPQSPFGEQGAEDTP